MKKYLHHTKIRRTSESWCPAVELLKYFFKVFLKFMRQVKLPTALTVKLWMPAFAGMTQDRMPLKKRTCFFMSSSCECSECTKTYMRTGIHEKIKNEFLKGERYMLVQNKNNQKS